MANTISALKRVRMTERKTDVNRVRRSRLRHQIRAIRRLIEAKDSKGAEALATKDILAHRPVRQVGHHQEEHGCPLQEPPDSPFARCREGVTSRALLRGQLQDHFLHHNPIVRTSIPKRPVRLKKFCHRPLEASASKTTPLSARSAEPFRPHPHTQFVKVRENCVSDPRRFASHTASASRNCVARKVSASGMYSPSRSSVSRISSDRRRSSRPTALPGQILSTHARLAQSRRCHRPSPSGSRPGPHAQLLDFPRCAGLRRP